MATPGPLTILSKLSSEYASSIAVTALVYYGIRTCDLSLRILAVFGTFIGLRIIFHLFRAIWIMFLRPAKSVREYGSWALVTGASDGIGKAFSEQLAKKGLNLLLVGRSLTRLEDVGKVLESKYKVQVKCVVVDFLDKEIEEGMRRIEEAINGLEVGVLVNNVGMSYPNALFFHEVNPELTRNLIRLNVEVTTWMVQLVLPGMAKRNKGCIVNIGSGAASILPSDPLYALYAATKAFVDQFSRSLYVEYKKMGIDVQCQFPLYVFTKMSKARRPTLACPAPETYARHAMRFIGYEARCTPYFMHAILWWVIGLFNEETVDDDRYKAGLKIRTRALAKLNAKKE